MRKYLAGLHEELREEVDLYPIRNIGDVCKKAMAFERLNRARGRGKSKQSARSKGKGKAKAETSEAGRGSGDGADQRDKKKGCHHCGKEGHTKAKCWKLHPEMAPKKGNGTGGYKGRTLVATAGEGATTLLLEDADPTLALMVRMVQDSKMPREKHGKAEPSQN